MEASERPDSLSYARATAETFWSVYRQRSGFDSEEALTAMFVDAAGHYPTDTQGHNFPHASDVAWTVMELADEYEAHGGEPLNRKLLVAAAVWHDAGSHEDYRAAGYEYAEDYAGALFESRAEAHGFTTEEADNVIRLISKTRQGIKPFSVDEKILVKADIYNVGTDGFETRTSDFVEEAKRRHAEQKKPWSLDRFVNENIKTLAAYLVNDLALWEGDNAWTARAMQNFNQYVTKTADKLGIKPAKYVAKLGNTAVSLVFARGIHSQKHGEDTTDQAAS